MEYTLLYSFFKNLEVSMLYDRILVRFGDLTLKGKNQKMFLKSLYHLVGLKMKGLNVLIEYQHDRIFIHLNDEDKDKVIKNSRGVEISSNSEYAQDGDYFVQDYSKIDTRNLI